MKCYLCDTETATGFFAYYCKNCNQIKRLISLYGLDRVFNILNNVLVRSETQQSYKLKTELMNEAKLLSTKKIEGLVEAKILRSSKEKDKDIKSI